MSLGELREKATSDLQAGCRELFTKILGQEKSDEMKRLKESGATNEELRKKGDEWINVKITSFHSVFKTAKFRLSPTRRSKKKQNSTP